MPWCNYENSFDLTELPTIFESFWAAHWDVVVCKPGTCFCWTRSCGSVEACGGLTQTWGIREGTGRERQLNLKWALAGADTWSGWREQHVGGPEVSFEELKGLPHGSVNIAFAIEPHQQFAFCVASA